MYCSSLVLTSALDGGLTPRPGRFTLGEKPGTYKTGGWVCPMAGLDGDGEHFLPLPASNPEASSRYIRCTDYTNSATLLRGKDRIFIHKCRVFLVVKGFHLHLNRTELKNQKC